MAPPVDVKLGRLTTMVCADARWLEEDGFPGWQVWADDLENLCGFLEGQGQFERFLPRLRGQNRQGRNATLGEIRAAFVLSRVGFTITAWEPEAVAGRPGDLEIELAGSPKMFVETKAPTWQGEVFEDDSRGDRQHKLERVRQEKWRPFEGRAVGPVTTPLEIIRANAIPKLAADRPNLVAVSDDMFVSPVGVPGLAEQVNHEADKGGLELVGGIVFVQPDPVGNDVVYRMQFVEIQAALPAVRIPTEAVQRLRDEENRSMNDRTRVYHSPLDSL
jgi:hypothetical protein